MKQSLLSPQVAVKTLKAELFHNQTDLEDFVKEGVLLSTLSHPYASLLYLTDQAQLSDADLKPEIHGGATLLLVDTAVEASQRYTEACAMCA